MHEVRYIQVFRLSHFWQNKTAFWELSVVHHQVQFVRLMCALMLYIMMDQSQLLKYVIIKKNEKMENVI